jgi:hypothetical protein
MRKPVRHCRENIATSKVETSPFAMRNANLQDLQAPLIFPVAHRTKVCGDSMVKVTLLRSPRYLEVSLISGIMKCAA